MQSEEDAAPRLEAHGPIARGLFALRIPALLLRPADALHPPPRRMLGEGEERVGGFVHGKPGHVARTADNRRGADNCRRPGFVGAGVFAVALGDCRPVVVGRGQRLGGPAWTQKFEILNVRFLETATEA